MANVYIDIVMLQYDIVPVIVELVLHGDYSCCIRIAGQHQQLRSFHPLTRAPYQGMSLFSDHPHRSAQKSERLGVRSAPRPPATANLNMAYRSTDLMHQFHPSFHHMPALRVSDNPTRVVILVKKYRLAGPNVTQANPATITARTKW